MSKHHARRHGLRAAATRTPGQIITAALIERLEGGTNPWRKPWTSAADLTRPRRWNGEAYRGINTIYLWMVAEAKGYTSPTWMTYNQAVELGGQVRRGEKSAIAVFFKSYGKAETDEATGDETVSQRRVMRSYHVFNVDQIEGLPGRFTTPAPARPQPDEDHRASVDAFIAAQGAEIHTGGAQACYIPSLDIIQMPRWQDFESYALYGATAIHELAHWTGHKSRLGRGLMNHFGSADYAREELVAEMASAMVGADLGLPAAHLDNHAAYLASWLTILKSDDNAIFKAAAKAEEAAQFLLGKAGRHAEGSNIPEADSDESAPMPATRDDERIAA